MHNHTAQSAGGENSMSAVGELELFRRVLRAEGPVLVGSPEDFKRVIGVMAARFGGLTDPIVAVFPALPGRATPRGRVYAWFESAEVDVVYSGHDRDGIRRAADDIDATPADGVGVVEFIDAALEWGPAERVTEE